MRTNIEIDDVLMSKAMKASGAKTKKAAVEQALRLVIEENAKRVSERKRRAEAGKAILALRGKVDFDEDYLAMIRSRNDPR